MPRKKKVLWIEDVAFGDLNRLATPIITDFKYGLTIATTVSRAISFMQTQMFDVYIFNLRMPPGDRGGWVNLAHKLARNKKPPHLGLYLLINLFPNQSPKNYDIKLPNSLIRPDIEQCGILSVDSYALVSDRLENIRFNQAFYIQKRAGMATNTLHNLVNRISSHI